MINQKFKKRQGKLRYYLLFGQLFTVMINQKLKKTR